jgi:hypothetical protein
MGLRRPDVLESQFIRMFTVQSFVTIIIGRDLW